MDYNPYFNQKEREPKVVTVSELTWNMLVKIEKLTKKDKTKIIDIAIERMRKDL